MSTATRVIALNNDMFKVTVITNMKIKGKNTKVLHFVKRDWAVTVNEVKEIFKGKNTVCIYNFTSGNVVSPIYDVRKREEGYWELGCQRISKENLDKLRGLIFEKTEKPKFGKTFNLNNDGLRGAIFSDRSLLMERGKKGGWGYVKSKTVRFPNENMCVKVNDLITFFQNKKKSVTLYRNLGNGRYIRNEEIKVINHSSDLFAIGCQHFTKTNLEQFKQFVSIKAKVKI